MQKALAFDSTGAGVAGGLLVYFAECAGVVLLAVREYAVAACASPAFVLVVVVREGDVDNFGGHFWVFHGWLISLGSMRDMICRFMMW